MAVVSVAVAMPWRGGDGRREELRGFVTDWIVAHHNWGVWFGDSPDGPFNRGAAVNNVAHRAQDDWSVLVVHDSDTICDPDMLRHAVEAAHASGRVVYPYETYIYLDEFSSNRLMRDNNWFISPELHHSRVFQTTVRHRHYSGIQVVPRSAYDAVGGYIELAGWGAEDAIMDILFRHFAKGSQWLQGGAYHLWHPANRNNPNDIHNVRNHQILERLKRMEKMREATPNTIRRYMAQIGHVIP